MPCSPLRGVLRFSARLLKPRCASRGCRRSKARCEPLITQGVSGQPRLIDWHCAFCGASDANQFTRDGHYQRSLETGWGHLDKLRVPMVECLGCQHDVVAHFAILEKYQRFWLDAREPSYLWQWFVPELTPLEPSLGQPRSDQPWDYGRSMNGSISSKRSCK